MEVITASSGNLKVEILCQDKTTIGTLFDRDVTAGPKLVVWEPTDTSGTCQPKRGFYLCRVTLPDTSYVTGIHVQ